MPLTGNYLPSSEQWVRDEVDFIERTGGSAFRERPVVLLMTVGSVTGALRKTPLMRVEHKGVYAVVASMAGSQTHPSWYGNLLAHPGADLRDGADVHHLTAREISGPERSAWWSRACGVFPSYADYQSRTRRKIPVLVLE